MSKFDEIDEFLDVKPVDTPKNNKIEKVEEKEDRIKRTPSKPNDKGEPVESIEDKNYGKPITKFAKDAVVTKMMNLSKNIRQ